MPPMAVAAMMILAFAYQVAGGATTTAGRTAYDATHTKTFRSLAAALAARYSAAGSTMNWLGRTSLIAAAARAGLQELAGQHSTAAGVPATAAAHTASTFDQRAQATTAVSDTAFERSVFGSGLSEGSVFGRPVARMLKPTKRRRNAPSNGSAKRNRRLLQETAAALAGREHA